MNVSDFICEDRREAKCRNLIRNSDYAGADLFLPAQNQERRIAAAKMTPMPASDQRIGTLVKILDQNLHPDESETIITPVLIRRSCSLAPVRSG